MHILPTSAPSAKLEGDRVFVVIQSGPTTLEISLTPYEAMKLGQTLIRAACEPIDASRLEAEIIAFPSKRTRRAS